MDRDCQLHINCECSCESHNAASPAPSTPESPSSDDDAFCHRSPMVLMRAAAAAATVTTASSISASSSASSALNVPAIEDAMDVMDLSPAVTPAAVPLSTSISASPSSANISHSSSFAIAERKAPEEWELEPGAHSSFSINMTNEDKSLYRACPPPTTLPPPLSGEPDRYPASEVRPDGPHGKTLIVLEDVSVGQPVIKFGGPIWSTEEYEQCEDYGHCLQIGARTFLGPYDGPDDYTDHCCDPTCYIVNRDDKEAILVAVKDMKAGDRVTFDYATTLLKDYRFFCPCACGAPTCRGVIQDFTLMTDEQQKDLYERGVLPKFIIDWYLNKENDPVDPKRVYEAMERAGHDPSAVVIPGVSNSTVGKVPGSK